MIAFTITEQGNIALIIDGKPYHINREFPYYEDVLSNLNLYLEHMTDNQPQSVELQKTIQENLVDILEFWRLKQKMLSLDD
jgi:hypothetical protein